MRGVFRIALTASLSVCSAFGWGCEGHQAIALIARAHLTPAASAAVDSLLRGNPIDAAITRFCKDRPNDPLADASTWADDAKASEKTAAWHYVDIPRSLTNVSSLAAWCPAAGSSVGGKNRPGCIVNAIEYELAVLRDPAESGADRATALRYVVHLVGDIHQPLHDDDNADEGGNCTALRFFAERNASTLHAIWDYKIIERELRTRRLSVTAYAARLDGSFTARFDAAPSAKRDDPDAWAWESHAIANSIAYGALQPGIPVETAGDQPVCAAGRNQVQALRIEVGDAYFRKAMPAIGERIAVAGFRLAVLLNDTFR